MKTLTTFICIVLGTMYVNFSFAASYTWLGATSTAWGTSTNWSPTGVPGAGDNVTIVTRTNQPTYNGVAGVTNFTMTSGTLNLNGYTLNISGSATFNSGTINNGKISVNSTTTLTVAGTLFNCKFTSLTNSFYLNGSTFNDSTFITRKASGGAGATSSSGGNKFHGYTEITNKSTGNIYLNNGGTVHADTAFEVIVFNMDSTGTLSFGHAGTEVSTFYSKVYLNRKAGSGTSTMYIASSGKVKFYDEVIMSNLSTGGYIYFGNNSGSSVTFTSKGFLKVGASGMGGATVYLKYFTKDNNLPTYLDFGSTARISIGPSSTINGRFDFTGKEFYLNGCTFNREIEFTSYNTNSISNSGGNVFNGSVSIINNGTGAIQLATSLGDDFNNDVVFTRGVGSGIIYPAYTKVNYFAGNITANGEGGVLFGQGSSANMSVLDGGFHQEISGSGTTIRFKKLKLNKSGSAGVFLNHDINVTDSLMLTSGIMETKTYVVQLNDNCKATGASNSSYIEGKVKKTGNDAFTFPVGKNGFYRSIAISAPSSTTNAYTAEYINSNSNSVHSHSSKDGTLNALGTTEYWKLDRNSGTTNVSVTLSWDTVGPSCSFANTANLKVAAWNGSTWKDKGNGATTGNRAAGTVVTNGTSDVYGAYALATSSTFYCVPCQAYAGPDSIVEIYYGDTVQLGQTDPGGYTYSWSPTTDLSASNISNPLAWPKIDVVYTLTATNTKGCAAKARIPITGHPRCITSSDYQLIGNTTWSGGDYLGTIPVTHPGGAIPNYVSGVTIFVNGTLTIEENILFAGCDIYFGLNARMIINSNCTISDLSHLHACYDWMWNGIIVNEGAHLVFDDGSRVEDAKTGIFVDGGTYRLSIAKFNKNYRHLYVKGDNSYLYDPGIIRESEFICEVFSTGTYTTLLNPYSGQRTSKCIELEGKMDFTCGDNLNPGSLFENSKYGIYAHDNPKLTLGEIDLGGMLNYFNHLDIGVYGTKLNEIKIEKQNVFSDINNMGIYLYRNHSANITIDDNLFNAGTGMPTINAGIVCIDNRYAPKTITNNTMDFAGNTADHGIGIAVLEAVPTINTVEISDNVIEDSYVGIFTSLLYGWPDFTEGSTTVNIDQNTVTNVTSLNSGEAGIIIQNGKFNVVSRNTVSQAASQINDHEVAIREDLGNSNWLSCNDVHDIGKGLYVSGDVRPWNVFIKNQMEDNQTGLFLNDAIIGSQGFLGNPFDNEWNGAWDINNPSTVTYGPNADGDYSPILTQDIGLPYEPVDNYIDNNAPNEISIVNTATHAWSGDACPVIHQFLIPSTNRKSLLSGIINESTRTGTRGINTQWMGLYGVYKYIQADEVMLESAGVESFYDSCFASNMGKLDRAMEYYSKLGVGEAEDFQDTLTAITPANNTETKVKAVLQILFDNVVNEEEELSAGQIEDLIEIAELCPYDYGFGVYMARNLLLITDTFTVRYYNDCEAVPVSAGKWDGENNQNSPTSSGSDNELFKLYPNPANNIIVLDYVLPDNQEINAIFELRDLTGRIIMNVQLNKNRTFINMDNLNAGVYSYSLLESEQIKYAGKQIIIK